MFSALSRSERAQLDTLLHKLVMHAATLAGKTVLWQRGATPATKILEKMASQKSHINSNLHFPFFFAIPIRFPRFYHRFFRHPLPNSVGNAAKLTIPAHGCSLALMNAHELVA